MAKSVTIRIAGVCIAIKSEAGLDDWDVDATYRPFVCHDRADILLCMLPGTPAMSGAVQVFDSSPIWTLHQLGDMKAFNIFDALNDQKRILVLDPDVRQAKLYFPHAETDFVDPFYGPALELLLIEYLTRQRGMIVHACGIDAGGQGILFVGESGAGKSTLSNLWCQDNRAAVLSDDRIILQKKDGAYWMHGTPWHGEAKFVSPRSVKLAHIYFLQHDKNNAVHPLNRAYTVVEFLKASFPPFWDSQGVELAMAFLSDLTAALPGRGLSFKPDASIVEFIKAQGIRRKGEIRLMAQGTKLIIDGQ